MDRNPFEIYLENLIEYYKYDGDHPNDDEIMDALDHDWHEMNEHQQEIIKQFGLLVQKINKYSNLNQVGNDVY